MSTLQQRVIIGYAYLPQMSDKSEQSPGLPSVYSVAPERRTNLRDSGLATYRLIRALLLVACAMQEGCLHLPERRSGQRFWSDSASNERTYSALTIIAGANTRRLSVVSDIPLPCQKRTIDKALLKSDMVRMKHAIVATARNFYFCDIIAVISRADIFSATRLCQESGMNMARCWFGKPADWQSNCSIPPAAERAERPDGWIAHVFGFHPHPVPLLSGTSSLRCQLTARFGDTGGLARVPVYSTLAIMVSELSCTATSD